MSWKPPIGLPKRGPPTSFASMPTTPPAGAGPFYALCGYSEMGRTTYRDTPLIYYEMLLG